MKKSQRPNFSANFLKRKIFFDNYNFIAPASLYLPCTNSKSRRCCAEECFSFSFGLNTGGVAEGTGAFGPIRGAFGLMVFHSSKVAGRVPPV
jgi:hypothetical protein